MSIIKEQTLLLEELFFGCSLPKTLAGCPVENLSDDSRCLGQNTLFFVRERKNFDIFSIIPEIEDKVIAFVVDQKDKEKFSCRTKAFAIFVKDINSEFIRVVKKYYQIQEKNISFVGVTGTNGKTTVTHLIHHALKQLDKDCALIGTIHNSINDCFSLATHTTPDFLSLHKLIKDCQKDTIVVMEVSSHAIDQGRVRGVDFSHCVLTNVTRDHLDYHKDFTHYAQTKRKLFLENSEAFAIFNLNDPLGAKWQVEFKKSFSYGIGEGEVFAENILSTQEGVSFTLLYRNESCKMHSFLLGEYNVSNLLAALSVLLTAGVSFLDAVKALSSARPVEGRLEMVVKNIFLDYAHTPDGLENVLKALRKLYPYIICVFGCGGNRDKGKRQKMGEIASRYANFSFITNDNPRHEEPQEIALEIEKGFQKENYLICLDREKAIKHAIFLQKRQGKSCLLVAGKGHEKYQIIGDKEIPFSDREIITKNYYV